jgi:hypothetical protein
MPAQTSHPHTKKEETRVEICHHDDDAMVNY